MAFERVIRIVVDSREAEDGSNRAKRSLRDVGDQAGHTGRDLESLGSTARFLKGALIAMVGSQVLRGVASLSDSAKTLRAQLTLVEGNTSAVATRMRDLTDMSLRTGTALEANVELYAKTKRALQDSVGASGDFLRATETVSKALTLSGADAQTAAGATRQLAQAFATGTLRSDEFISVSEGAPRLMRLLADSMGVPIGSLRTMAAEGQLTSQKLYTAMTDKRFTESLDEEFRQLPPTFERAVENIRTAAIRVFGEFDRGGSFSNSILGFSQFSEDSLDQIATKAYETGVDIRLAFSALDDIFSPLLQGALDVFSQIGIESQSLSESIAADLGVFDKLSNAYRQQQGRNATFENNVREFFGLEGNLRTDYGVSNQQEEYQRQRDAEIGYDKRANAFFGDDREKADALAALGRVRSGNYRPSSSAAPAPDKAAERAAKKAADEAQRAADADERRLRTVTEIIAEMEREAKYSSMTARERAKAEAVYELEVALRREDGSMVRQITDMERERVTYLAEAKVLQDQITDGLDAYTAKRRQAQADADQLKDMFDPDGSQGRQTETLQKRIREAVDQGLITPEQGKKWGEEAGDKIADQFSTRFRDETALAAVAVGQAMGGTLGGFIQDFAGIAQGLQSGDFTGVRGRGGGIATLLSGVFGKDGGFKEGLSDVFDPLKDTFKDLAGGLFKGDGAGFSKFAGKAAGGAAIGGVTDDVLGMLGAKSSKMGAQLGGAAGAFLPIPGGAIIGSVAGGLLGGLFKSNRTAGAVVTGADSLTLGGKDKGNYEQASTLGGAVQEGLKSLADVLGGELGRFQVAIGTRGDEIRVNTRGDSLKGKNGARGFGDDAEAAVAYAIQDALADGALKGVSTFTQRILRGAGDLDKAVDTAAKYETVLKRLAEGTDNIGTQAKDFAKTFMDLSEAMRDAGATTAELANVEKLYAQERKTVMDQILAPLLDYQKELSGEGSGVTAMDRLQAATERYNQAESDFKAGKITGDQFSEAGQERFGLARDVYGTSTREFQSIRQELLSDAESALGTATGRFESGAPEQLQRENNEIAAKVYQQNVIANDNLKAIQEQLARISANGGLNFSFVNGGLSAH